MVNTAFNNTIPPDEFTSMAQQAAVAAQAAEQNALNAQAAAEAALASTLSALGALTISDLSDADTTGAIPGDALVFDGTIWRSEALDLDDLGNVVVPSPGTGDILQFDGSDWISAPLSVSGFLPTSGGTLTGALTLSGDETDPMDAASRAFVEASIPVAFPYDLIVFFNGVPEADEDIYRLVSVRDFTIFNSPTAVVAVARVAPSDGPYVVTIQMNGAAMGTITFANGSTNGVAAIPADIVLSSGDTLELVGQTTPDSTIEDLQITLIGNI